jgi:hypothetical protein
MAKISLKDVENRIVKRTVVPYAKSNKVNVNDLIKSGRIRKRKKKKTVHKSFPVKCITYDTPEEIQFMKSLLRMRVITNTHKGITIDLGEEDLFLRLNQIDQLKLIIGLLQSGIDVTIDECVEQSNDENIKQIKAKLDSLEKLESERQLQKAATLEKLMWIRYGNKGNRDPIQKQKELAEFRQQMKEIRKAKGLE